MNRITHEKRAFVLYISSIFFLLWYCFAFFVFVVGLRNYSYLHGRGLRSVPADVAEVADDAFYGLWALDSPSVSDAWVTHSQRRQDQQIVSVLNTRKWRMKRCGLIRFRLRLRLRFRYRYQYRYRYRYCFRFICVSYRFQFLFVGFWRF